MKNFTTARMLAALVVVLGSTTALAQPTPANSVIAGLQRKTLASRVLGETRTFDVTLPGGYDTNPDARYPVLVVLDGEFEGEVAAAIARFYTTMNMLPGVIVVGVHNQARTRDLTPKAIPPFNAPPGESGGADRFLSFLADELLPLIDREYRTAPMRVLIGHSLGGLFALHALAQRPDVFLGYVVMEPSVWWNNHQPLEAARDALKRPPARRARVMLVNAMSLTADTISCGGDQPMVRHIRVQDETHGSMAAIGIATALRRMFEDFRPPEWRPGSTPIQMLERYDSLAARVGYVVPIPTNAYATVVRMSLDSRLFEDAARALTRWETTYGVSSESRELRARLEQERAQPTPAGFIPLVIPARRPSPADAARFLGRWQSIDSRWPTEVEIRAAGDTIIVHERIVYPEGEPFDADVQVIQVTETGKLEWGLPFFRGLAALLVQQATLESNDMMVVRDEARGWLPRDPNYRPGQKRYKRIR